MKKGTKVTLGVVLGVATITACIYGGIKVGINLGYKQVHNYHVSNLYDLPTSGSLNYYVEEKDNKLIITCTNLNTFTLSIQEFTVDENGNFTSAIEKYPVLNKKDFNKKYKGLKYVEDSLGRKYAVANRNIPNPTNKDKFIESLRKKDLGKYFKYIFVEDLNKTEQK